MKVKLRGVTKVAKEHGLRVIPVKVNDNTYATGQGILPNDPDTVDNLTLKEMLGEKQLTADKMKRFPFIINPYARKTFQDGHLFDLDNPEENALLNLILISADRVAPSKGEFNRMKHDFYIENRTKESEKKTKSFRKTIKAGIAVEKLSPNEMLELADYLFVNHNEANCSRDREVSVITNTIYEYSATKPDFILDALKKDNKTNLYVSSLVIAGILTKKGADFYEGKTFIATTFEKVVSIYNTDLTKAARWDGKLREKSKNAHITFDEPILDITGIKNEFLMAIFDEDVAKIDELTITIKKSASNELMALLVKFNDKVKVIKNPPKSEEPKKLTLLESADQEPFMVFKSKFQKFYQDYDGELKKQPMKDFLQSLKSE